MDKLKSIIETRDTFAGRVFDYIIQFLIIVSIISFSIETLPILSDELRSYLKLLELVIVAIFSIEYLLRIIVSNNSLKFIFSFEGIIDLLAILPFYVRVGIDLRSIRIFRLFRLFRAFKLLRYSKAITRFKSSILFIKAELILFSVTTICLIYLSAVGIYYFENDAQPESFSSVFESLWWAVATLTTVGYGDVYPITIGGKIFTFFILMIGLSIVAIPAGLISSALTRTFEEEADDLSTPTNN